MKRPGTVSPRHHRDQLDDGAGSFWPTLRLTCTIAGGAALFAWLVTLVTGFALFPDNLN